MSKDSFILPIQNKIDNLLDFFDDGLEGLKKIAKALEDEDREVRQAAFFLLAETEDVYAKQLLYNYLPFSNMNCSCIITEFRKYVENNPDFLVISNYHNKLIGYWNFDFPYFVKSWDLATGKVKNDVDLRASEPNLFGVGKEGKIILSSDQNYIRKYNSGTLDDVEKFQDLDIRNHQYLYALRCNFAICPTNHSLVAIAEIHNTDNNLEVKNYETYKIHLKYKFERLFFNTIYIPKTKNNQNQNWIEQISCLIFSPDGKKLVSTLHYIEPHTNISGSLLHIWDVESKEVIQVLESLPKTAITSLGINPAGNIIACGVIEDKISVWDLQTNSAIYTIDEFAICMISNDARILFYATVNYDIIIWDLVENKQLNILKGHTAPLMYLLMTNDKEFLVSYSIDKQIRIWSVT